MQNPKRKALPDSTEEPVAKRQKTLVEFGRVSNENRGDEHDIIDPPLKVKDYYYWLRDNERKNKEVIKYLEDENKYSEQYMKDTNNLQEDLYDEIISRVKEDDQTYPYPSGDGGYNSKYRYYSRTEEGKSYTIYCRINMSTNIEEIILDVNKLAQDKNQTHCDVSGIAVSSDHNTLAYGLDLKGDEDYELIFKDLQTGYILDYKLPTKLPGANIEWAPDNKSVYYVTADSTKRANKLWSYDLDNDISELIYEETDILFDVDFHISACSNYLFVTLSSFDTSEVRYLDLNKKSNSLNIIQYRIDGHKYTVDSREGNFIIRTNKDKCHNFKLVYTNPVYSDMYNWKDIKPADPEEYITDFSCFKNFIAVCLRKNGFKKIAIIKNEYSIKWKYIDLPEDVASVNLAMNCVYDTDKLWLVYTSMTQPYILYEYDTKQDKLKVLKKKIVPNYNSKLYESKLIFAPSYYGQKVPISIVYRKSMKKNNSPQPMYLYGYGSYGMCCDPKFNHQLVSLMDRGFLCATAHVRGGAELGHDWYTDGKMHTKMNTFLDFISCTEYLIKSGYTTSNTLAIEGRSAGGLLMGAVMTMRPDLFNTVVAVVPFVDVLNTMADPSIPLTTQEWEQWGNPNKLTDYTYMKQYSPYDNINKTNYPNSLFLAGYHDPRVQYWEPAKFVAKLRHMKTDTNVHLLKTDMHQGHFGGSDRYKYIKETAFIYSFIIKNILNKI